MFSDRMMSKGEWHKPFRKGVQLQDGTTQQTAAPK